MNTHLDHLGKTSRSARISITRVFNYAPCLPLGRFRCFFLTQSEIQPVLCALCKGQPPKRDLHDEGDYRHKIMQI